MCAVVRTMSDTKPMEVEQEKKEETPVAEAMQTDGQEAGKETPAEPEKKDEMKVDEPPVEEKKQALVLGIDFGTQKCVAAVSSTDFIFPRIVQNNLANQATP